MAATNSGCAGRLEKESLLVEAVREIKLAPTHLQQLGAMPCLDIELQAGGLGKDPG